MHDDENEPEPPFFLTEEQKAELDRRLALYELDPNQGSPWEEVKERLLNRKSNKPSGPSSDRTK